MNHSFPFMLQYRMKYYHYLKHEHIWNSLHFLTLCYICYTPNLQMQTSIFLHSSLVILRISVNFSILTRNYLTEVVTSKIRSLGRLTALWNINFITFTKNDLQFKTESILQLDFKLSILN